MLSRLRAGAKVIYSRDARRRLARLLDATRPDIAHLHLFQQQFSHAILPELKQHGIPIVNTVHDLKPVCPNYKMLTHDGLCERCVGGHFYHCTVHRCIKGSLAGSLLGSIEMYVARFAGYYELIDRFIATNHWYATKLAQGGIPAHKIVVEPYACDLQRFAPRYDDDGYVVFVGRLAEEKGVPTLLEAMRHVGSSAGLKIVGTGPLEVQLRECATAFGLRNVEFLGFQSGETLQALLAGAMCFVVPSEWYENSPLVIYEAMSLGKPVIGSRVGGIPELIVEDETGVTFEPGNAQTLAAALERLVTNPGLRHHLGRNARQRAETVYAPRRPHGRLLAIYESCNMYPLVEARCHFDGPFRVASLRGPRPTGSEIAARPLSH